MTLVAGIHLPPGVAGDLRKKHWAEPGTEERQVQEWRFARLLDLGVPPDDAIALAAGLSWHEAETLLAAGCPPSLVCELLA